MLQLQVTAQKNMAIPGWNWTQKQLDKNAKKKNHLEVEDLIYVEVMSRAGSHEY